MAAMGNLLIKDDTAGGVVEHTLYPITDTPIPLWRENASGVPFEGQMRFSLSEEKLKSGDYKRTAKLEVPVMETLGASGTAAGYVAPPKVAYTEVFIVTHFSSRRSTSADRGNALKLLVGALQGASATTASGVLNQASSAGAFVGSVLPVPAFYTAGIVPN